jgi:ribose 5-phosphate isomerase A
LTAASIEREKRVVAEAAAELVTEGMRVGLGTGSTVEHLLPALARRRVRDVVYAATSPETHRAARQLRLDVRPFSDLDGLDLAIDGADQVAPSGWLVKGGGGAHTREKVVATAAERFVVIVSANKLVSALTPPVPLELVAFGVEATLRLLRPAALRSAPPTPNGGVLADYLGPVEDACELMARLSLTPGVVENGLFPPQLASEILVATGTSVRSFRPAA